MSIIFVQHEAIGDDPSFFVNVDVLKLPFGIVSLLQNICSSPTFHCMEYLHDYNV